MYYFTTSSLSTIHSCRDGQFSREWDEEKAEARDEEDEIMDVNSHLLYMYSIARLTVHRTAAMHRAMYHLVL